MNHFNDTMNMIDDTRVIRTALVSLLPWLRDHMNSYYDPRDPGYVVECVHILQFHKRVICYISP
jgi:hypothetical protein